MKSLNTLLLASSAAAAVVLIGLAASAFGSTLTPNQLGTPDDGMICRSGYTGALVGKAFKCSKTTKITVELECLKPAFQEYVRRAVSPGSDGKDLCLRSDDIEVSSNGPLTGLTQGVQYVFAEVNPATVTTEVTGLDAEEAAALGLAVSEVDTIAGQATIKVDPGRNKIKDEAEVPVTHYTFAIKTGPLASVR